MLTVVVDQTLNFVRRALWVRMTKGHSSQIEVLVMRLIDLRWGDSPGSKNPTSEDVSLSVEAIR